MSIQVIRHAQHTHCYKCGSREILCICHHCGRAMCEAHRPSLRNDSGNLMSIEFIELGLKNVRCGEGAVHCEYCDHMVRKPRVLTIIAGIIISLIGVVVLIHSFAPGIIALIIGIGLSVGGYLTYQKRKADVGKSRPSLPLFPRFEPIKMRELLRGHITLGDDGDYRISTSPVEAQLNMEVKFAKPERDQLQLYRQKYELDENKDIKFHAGFATFRGPVGFQFEDENTTCNESGTVIPLTGYVNNNPYLDGSSERGLGEWGISLNYKLLEEPKAESLPLRLVPSLVQQKGQRVLEFEIQWGSFNHQEHELMLSRIELVEIHAPVAWGEVESEGAKIGQTTSESGEAVRTITWIRPSIDENERSDQRCAFFICFENKIDLSRVIQGKIEVTFKTALSLISGIDLYYPVGTKREEGPTDIKTRVVADFDLSLAGLRHQDVRLVPNPKREVDKNKQEIMTFEGVIPNHTTVVALTNAMCKQDFYVQRVIEDPPRTGERANLINRSWDIAGRRYLGVYPIDYHLTLSGEEKYNGDIRAQAGTTKTMLKVQGMYANPEMEEQIENVWEQLVDLIQEIFQQLPKPIPVTSKPDVPLSPIAERPASTQVKVDEHLEHFNELYRHLDQLMEAFTAARVFEKTYLEIKSRIERELQALQSSFANLYNF